MPISLTFAVFANMLVMLALGPFLPAIAESLTVEVALAGQVPAAMMLLAAAIGLIAGQLADRYGARTILEVGLVSALAGALAIGLAHTFLLLLVLAPVASIGRATVMPLAQAVASAHVTGDEPRRRAIGWITAGVPLASLLGIPLLTLVGEWLHWRAAFLVVAGLTVVAVLLVRTMVPAIAQSPARPALQPAGGALALGSYLPLAEDRLSLQVIGASLLSNIGIWCVMTYLGAYYAEHHSLLLREVGLVYLVAGVALFLGSVLVARLLRGLTPFRALFYSRLVSGLLIGLGMILPLPPLATVALLGIGMLAVGISAVITADILAVSAIVGPATALTLNGSALSLGVALGAAVGGLVLSQGGFLAVGLSAIAFGLAAGVLVIRPTGAVAVAA